MGYGSRVTKAFRKVLFCCVYHVHKIILTLGAMALYLNRQSDDCGSISLLNPCDVYLQGGTTM